MDNRRISQLRAITARVLGLFRSRKRDREFDEEMQAHLQLLVDRFVAQGMSQEDAAAAARRQFGNTTLLQEDRRELRTLVSVEEIVVLVDDNEVSPPLILQRIPEAKNGKNRMHIDIVRDDVEAEVARLEALGARRHHDGLRSMGPTLWVTMADPDDNEFCVSTGVEW